MTTETTDDPRIKVYLDGLTKILVDLDKVRTRNPEIVMLIGSLADRLCHDAGKPNWPEVKAGLSDSERQSLIGTFSRNIEDSGNKGDIATAYAMQAVATSLVGDTMGDERATKGVALLDNFIAAARSFFQRNKPAIN